MCSCETRCANKDSKIQSINASQEGVGGQDGGRVIGEAVRDRVNTSLTSINLVSSGIGQSSCPSSKDFGDNKVGMFLDQLSGRAYSIDGASGVSIRWKMTDAEMDHARSTGDRMYGSRGY